MTTTVIHLRNSTPNSVYIGRPGKSQPNAIFGNPYAKGVVCGNCRKIHKKGGDTLPCYERYLRDRLQDDADFNQKFYELKGATLACFCCPKDGFKPGEIVCHGQVMAYYLDGEPIKVLPPVEDEDWEEDGWRLKEPESDPTNENPSSKGTTASWKLENLCCQPSQE